MQGLILDHNIQGHSEFLLRLLENEGLWEILAQLQMRVATFPELSLARDIDDRSLWNYCQTQRWVLLTANRNRDDPDSLEAVLNDSWQVGQYPVLTLANEQQFARNREYAKQTAVQIGELMFDVFFGDRCDQPRIFVPH